MAASIKIDIRDQATEMLRNIPEMIASLPGRIGPAVKTLVADHLFAKDSEGNKNGWPTQHFYAAAGKSCQWQETGSGVVVSINKQGIRQRIEGGEIKPVNAKYLTIPACAEAYGKRAAEFGNLKVLFGRQKDSGQIGPIGLIAGDEGATRKVFQGREGTRPERTIPKTENKVMFWFSKGVYQAGDPSVIPTEQEITETALAAIGKAVKLFQQRKGLAA